MPIEDFQPGISNWRQQLAKNEQKTKWVIACFILIFLFVGLLFDAFLALSQHQASLSKIFIALLTFQIPPVATGIMLVIAFISLLITYSLYDKIMLLGTDSYEITSLNASTLEEKQLFNVVEEMKIAAGLTYMPRVYLIRANYMNAFASGYSEKSAMVAITTGLMAKLDRAELQAVMAHELSHIKHHDIKLTLTVSVLSNIMLIAIDVLFYNMLYGGRVNKDNDKASNKLFLIVMLLRFILPFITLLLTLFLSRTREYMADSGAVKLMRDNEPMARALLKIQQDHQDNQDTYRDDYGVTAHEGIRRASYIFDPMKFSKSHDPVDLFSTHPSIRKRLKALGFIKTN